MFGSTELLVILLVALLVLGPKKLPSLARALGRGLRELRRAMHSLDDLADDEKPAPPAPSTPPTEPTLPPLEKPAPPTDTKNGDRRH